MRSAQLWLFFFKSLAMLMGRLPRFTFSPFTRDPNLQQTKFTRDPNLQSSKFTQNPNLHETKFTHDPNLHENLHKTRFTQTQIYTKPIFTRSQIYTNPNLHINRNSKEGQTYDIFLKSPWYEDLKNNSPECLACKYTNIDQNSRVSTSACDTRLNCIVPSSHIVV